MSPPPAAGRHPSSPGLQRGRGSALSPREALQQRGRQRGPVVRPVALEGTKGHVIHPAQPRGAHADPGGRPGGAHLRPLQAVLALRSPCPSGQSIPSTLTGPSSARRKRRLFPVALRPLFPKAKRINLKGATAGDGGVFHGGFAATAGEALAAACRPLPGGRGSAPSPPAQGPPGPLDLAASAPRHTDPAPRPSVAGCVHAPRRQESRPREPGQAGPRGQRAPRPRTPFLGRGTCGPSRGTFPAPLPPISAAGPRCF